MKRTSFSEMSCSIARTLDVVGEWWTLLVIRDVFYGVRRFESLLRHLGISRNVLTDRLNTLVANEILERVRYQGRPDRFEYRLTRKGLDLFPILMVLRRWGNEWLGSHEGAVDLIHRRCGKITRPVVVCDECGEALTARDVHPRPGPGTSRDEIEVLKREATGGLFQPMNKKPGNRG